MNSLFDQKTGNYICRTGGTQVQQTRLKFHIEKILHIIIAYYAVFVNFFRCFTKRNPEGVLVLIILIYSFRPPAIGPQPIADDALSRSATFGQIQPSSRGAPPGRVSKDGHTLRGCRRNGLRARGHPSRRARGALLRMRSEIVSHAHSRGMTFGDLIQKSQLNSWIGEAVSATPGVTADYGFA